MKKYAVCLFLPTLLHATSVLKVFQRCAMRAQPQRHYSCRPPCFSKDDVIRTTAQLQKITRERMGLSNSMGHDYIYKSNEEKQAYMKAREALLEPLFINYLYGEYYLSQPLEDENIRYLLEDAIEWAKTDLNGSEIYKVFTKVAKNPNLLSEREKAMLEPGTSDSENILD